jgi:Zn finger protein HypA/HybF involved in hydrogenase expression
MTIKYNFSTGKIIGKRFSLQEIEAAIQGDNSTGFCRACGAEQDGVEPDARRYECESCGHHQVYGAEELVLMGLVS